MHWGIVMNRLLCRPLVTAGVGALVLVAVFRAGASEPVESMAASAGIAVETTIDGVDANTAPGPSFLAGRTVTVMHVIHNTGGIDFTLVELLGTDGACAFPPASLSAGESMSCSYDIVVAPGAHDGQIHAVGSANVGNHVSATGAVHYFGAAPAIDVEVYVAGQDADSEPGPYIPIDRLVELHYAITNTGNVELLVDGLFAECPQVRLMPGQREDCSRMEYVGHDQNVMMAAVRGTPPGFPPVIDLDSAYYYGAAPGLHMHVRANGADAGISPGPLVETGKPINWSFELANTGNLPLMLTALSDTHGGPVECPQPSLEPNESITCTASGVAEPGLQPGLALAAARLPGDWTITAASPSSYFGASPDIELEVLTNGLDYDAAPGPELIAGSQVNTTYLVRNTGNVQLSNIGVVDDHIGQIACSETTLRPGGWTACFAIGFVVPGPVSRTAIASGVPAVGSVVADSDPTHYTGSTFCLFDCNGDARTDLSDFAEFMLRFSGP